MPIELMDIQTPRRTRGKMMTMMARIISSSGTPMLPMGWLLNAAIVPLFTAALVAQFASGVNVIEVYATVSDAHGDPVICLPGCSSP